jgi:hypothetical protein
VIEIDKGKVLRDEKEGKYYKEKKREKEEEND